MSTPLGPAPHSPHEAGHSGASAPLGPAPHSPHEAGHSGASAPLEFAWDLRSGEIADAPPAGKWAAAWERVFERFGPASIRILGEEPLSYPGFTGLLAAVSKRHAVDLTTNLPLEPGAVAALAAAVDPKRLHVGASFHPARAEIGPFLAKVRHLQEAGIGTEVRLLAYPPLLKDLRRCVETCGGEGVAVRIEPFIGMHEGKSFPEDYSGEEWEALSRLPAELGPRDQNADPPRTRGKACFAGAVYASVKPDGEVLRCRAAGAIARVGNLFDPDFKLLGGAAPCPVSRCVRGETRFLAEEYEDRLAVSAMFERLVWLGNAGVMIDGPVKIYFDPVELEGEHPKADVILLTHAHFDHCSKDAVDKITGPGTVVVGPAECLRAVGASGGRGVALRPWETKTVRGVPVTAVPAFNTRRMYHPEAKGWLGLAVDLDGVRVFHAGDAGGVPDYRSLDPDIAMLAVDDVYNSGPIDAFKIAKMLGPLLAIPLHYWPLCGREADADQFLRECRGAGIHAEKFKRHRLPSRSSAPPDLVRPRGKAVEAR